MVVLTYISYSYSTSEPAEHKFIRSIFESNKAVLALLIISPPVFSVLLDIWEWFGRYLQERERNYFPSIQQTTILAALNIIVGKKLDRFGLACKSLTSKSSTSSEAFHTITRPDEQINEITSQLWGAMVKLTEINDLEVVLVSVAKDYKLDYVNYHPISKKPDDQILSSGSFFNHVARCRKFCCIPDIAKHISEMKSKRRHERRAMVAYLTIDGDTPTGSIAGIPIIHNHLSRVVYVLTFKSSQPHALSQSLQKLYGEMWRTFIDRILLEHSLKEIKSHVHQN